MTDEELVKRLRDDVNGEHDMTPHGADCLQAADRIDALTEKLEAARADAKEAETYAKNLREERDTLRLVIEANIEKHRSRAEAAEAKLAKAVEGLREIAGECGCSTARAMLAEIEGKEP